MGEGCAPQAAVPEESRTSHYDDERWHKLDKNAASLLASGRHGSCDLLRHLRQQPLSVAQVHPGKKREYGVSK